MSTKTMVLRTVCALAVIMVSVAANQAFAQEDPDERPQQRGPEFVDTGEHGPPHEFVEITERIERLRAMAREAEERARRFRAEAEELERQLPRELEPGPPPEHMEEMHAKLTELNEAARRAKAEGRHDEAAELHEEATRIAEEIETRARKRQDRVPPELAQRLEELHLMAGQAKERGEFDKADQLLAEAEEIERELRSRPERTKAPPHLEDIERRLAEFKETAQRAEREGRHEEAARIRDEAHKFAMEVEKAARRDKMAEVGRQIDHLNAMAAEAKKAGQHEKAKGILREAKELQRRQKSKLEPVRQGPNVKELQHQIQMLREEVGRLRMDLDMLRRDRPDRDRPRDPERDRPQERDRPDRDRPREREGER